MRKIKKPIAFLLVLAVLTLFSGYNGRVKIRDRVIIQGMALDTENDTYFLTVQTYKPSSLQEPKNEYELHTASGSTFYESLQSINSITGQQVFFSNLQVIIISRSVADKGLSTVLDFFARYSEIRKNVTVVASACKAAELLTIDSESGILPAERINKIMSYGTDTSSYDGSKLLDITERYLSDTTDAFLPLLDINENDSERTVKICGVLCFSGNLPSGIMSPADSVGFNWISGYDSRQSLIVDSDSGRFTLSVQGVSCKISAKETSDNSNSDHFPDFNSSADTVPEIDIELKLKFNVNEVNTKKAVISEKDILDITPLLSEKVKERAEQSVNCAFYELDSDIFELGKYVRRDCPSLYQSERYKKLKKSDWKINISARAEIYRVGKTNRTI